MSYQNLMEITKYLEQYEQLFPEKPFSLEQFSYWLSDSLATKPRSINDSKTTSEESFQQQSPDVQISILIGRMAKYARVYTKKIFASNHLSGMDDFGFMATLMFRESMTKSELTHHNLMDSATSGADIIKRLIKQGYIEEFDDSTDRRSRRVKITDMGKYLMFQVFNEMDTVASVITGNLANDEKLFLLGYLKKLEHFHKDIYDHDRKMEISAIQQKYKE
ncbi:MAG: MarR family winged helix-turn-helix transcriptional regulator [Salinivirgaceae bacterium]